MLDPVTGEGRTVLDLFSAAAGGWSLGMHRAGFTTIAACENVDWRRTLYAQNNPGVPIYDDVCTLTAERLLRDIGKLPTVIVGSPPCQDISSANTKGKGVEGERSGLFFEAVRLIGECRPRWFALENSSNLRTRGADAVLSALEAIGYACWATVVRAGDIGANHERPRSWLIGCDLEQVPDPDGMGWHEGRSGRGIGCDLSVQGDHPDTASIGHEGGRTWRHGQDGDSAPHAGDASQNGCGQRLPRGPAGATGRPEQPACGDGATADAHGGSIRQPELPGGSEQEAAFAGDIDQGEDADAAQIGSEGEPGRPRWQREGEEPERADLSARSEMGLCSNDRGGADGSWPLWSLDDLAGRLRVDDGLPGRLAATRVAVGGPRGTSAASLIVEAYGDAVIPQIPEAIGRAILRTERALASIYERAAA
mgnify:CR=1 FL=1